MRYEEWVISLWWKIQYFILFFLFFSCFFFLTCFFVSQHLCSISRQHKANFVLLSAICNKVYLKFSLSVLLRANLTTFHQNLLKDLYLSPWPSLKWKVIIRANWLVFYIPIITVLHGITITPYTLHHQKLLSPLSCFKTTLPDILI